MSPIDYFVLRIKQKLYLTKEHFLDHKTSSLTYLTGFFPNIRFIALFFPRKLQSVPIDFQSINTAFLVPCAQKVIPVIRKWWKALYSWLTLYFLKILLSLHKFPTKFYCWSDEFLVYLIITCKRILKFFRFIVREMCSRCVHNREIRVGKIYFCIK